MFRLRKIHAAVLAAALVAAGAATSPVAQPLAPTQVMATTICTPSNVAEFGNRIHVHCTTAVSGISYFAVATSNVNRAAHALSLFSIAIASGRDLRIYYDPANTSGTAVGCQAADCRLADGVELL
jgi:hypothetical protein